MKNPDIKTPLVAKMKNNFQRKHHHYRRFHVSALQETSIINHKSFETKLSECGDRETSYVVPQLFQFGASGYRELCLIAWFCTPPISGYMIAKRMHESNPCWKERSPIKFRYVIGMILVSLFFYAIQ